VSAPPLPEAFGNYALGDFVEVVSPAAINWLPQTIGWWWLGAFLLALTLRKLWQRLRHWYRNRYRREGLQRLQSLTTEEPAEKLREVNKLLKLVAMAAYSRERVASLSGPDWAEFLNRQCPAPAFSAAQCQALAGDIYRPDNIDSAALSALIEASGNWVREHQETLDD
jgi:hypothetical protein